MPKVMSISAYGQHVFKDNHLAKNISKSIIAFSSVTYYREKIPLFQNFIALNY